MVTELACDSKTASAPQSQPTRAVEEKCERAFWILSGSELRAGTPYYDASDVDTSPYTLGHRNYDGEPDWAAREKRIYSCMITVENFGVTLHQTTMMNLKLQQCD